MHTLQDEMSFLVDLADSLASWRAPGEKDNTLGSLSSHEINDLLREGFPAPISVRIGLVSTHSQTGIEEEHTTISPWSKQSAPVGRWCEVGIIVGDGFIDILKRRRCNGRWTDGEGEAVCLIDIMVRILTNDDGLHTA
jgi:hypothetical protein